MPRADQPDRAAGPPPVVLNDSQRRSILVGCLDIHRRMADMEALLTQGTDPSPFSQCVNDLSPTESGVVRDYFARIRSVLLDLPRQAGIITRRGLVEFRPLLDQVVRRLESPQFEIAVFGRVSSGKSSLLNHVAGMDVLPVGVTPITAVPTRLVRGDRPAATISFAETGPR